MFHYFILVVGINATTCLFEGSAGEDTTVNVIFLIRKLKFGLRILKFYFTVLASEAPVEK
jgi:hypothetical protein